MASTIYVNSFPSSPGVYLMKGANGSILYVGKAGNLRQRVRSYFRQAGDSRLHIQFLMAKVAGIDFIVTDTEKEALILENTLIKKHHPQYNLNLRDDKTYFSLRMDMREDFPRLTIVRKVPSDGARYFGPYSSASAAREVIKELRKIFPLRHYPLETCRRRKRPCIFYQIKQCPAPCFGLISSQEYLAIAEGVILFLEGKNRELLKVLKNRMAEAASAEQFEAAARFRDRIQAIDVTLERQKMVTRGGDSDVIGHFRNGSLLEIAILFIRGGSIIGCRNFSLKWEFEDSEGISSFLNEYYGGEVFIPEELLLSAPLPENAALAELLTEKRGLKVTVTSPHRGIKAELVDLASRNAAASAAERNKAVETSESILAELQERLHLPVVPRRIECYDISNIGGRFAVGSMVVFRDGAAEKGAYRRFRIRTIAQADDFGMMQEVMARRFRESGENDLPDLILVDGGIGQLNAVTSILDKVGASSIATAALAKSRVIKGMERNRVERTPERVFLPGRKNPVVLRQNSAPLLLLARIRDEAHRFAVTYHKKLRGKGAISSILTEIAGIGEKRRKALLRHFGSLQLLKDATVAEIAAVNGLTVKIAESVWEQLHQKGEIIP